MKSASDPLHARDYIEELAAAGRYHFDVEGDCQIQTYALDELLGTKPRPSCYHG